jgi:asparagine synthase (glutamine-hydrolysing)
MRDSMEHRGPDDCGLHLSPDRSVGLGHRRLTIVDLSAAGRQPMSNEDGTVWITFNGEIYNHQELRHDLEGHGHRYRSMTDTESVIHLYEEQGVECLQNLRGMFAFGLWDSRRKRLLLARDRLGVKPLYYAYHDGCFLFSSEIKALLSYPGFPRDLEEASLYHYLTFLTTPAPSTLFKGIHKLPAGYRLVLEKGKEARSEAYWDAIVSNGPSHQTEGEVAERIQALLSESIGLRMMSDVPFGVLLSGGLDSSTNVALMDRISDRPVETFTVGYKEQESYNEFQSARQIAEIFKTNHHEILIDQDELFEFLPSLVHYQDEPIADPVCIPLYYVSKLAKDNGVTVVQVGEGSDELFCGYPGYLQALEFQRRIWPGLSALPGFLKKALFRSAFALSERYHRGYQFREYLRKAVEGQEPFWGGAIGFSETDKHKVLSPQFREKWRGLNSYEAIQPHYERIAELKPESDPLERMIYLELKLRLPETLLMRVDKITMATSVEARVPFLDHRLVEFAMGLSMDMKVSQDTKSILKKAVEGVIPNEIIHRKKQGFSVPVKEWVLERLGGVMEEVFRRSELRERELFDYEYVNRMLAVHRAGSLNFSGPLWNLLNLHLWYDHWWAREGDPRQFLPVGARN